VAPNHLTKQCHMSRYHSTSTVNQNMPCHRTDVWSSHITSSKSAYGHATSASVRTVRTAQSTLFLSIWRFKQIAISLAPDIRLRRNELRWIRDDEGYALVRFEAIPRTLIFWLKFDPWSRFWLDNLLLHSNSQSNQLHQHKNGYGYSSGTIMKIQNIAQWVCA
jgi:hypothetical protein